MAHSIDYIYRFAIHAVIPTSRCFIELIVELTLNILNVIINSTIYNIWKLINNLSDTSFGTFNCSLRYAIDFTVESSNRPINNRAILLSIYYNIC